MDRQTRLLLIEDSSGTSTVRAMLRACKFISDITVVDCIRDSIRLIDDGLVDLILLDLAVRDNKNLHGFQRLRLHATDIPIIILSADDDTEIAESAVRSGAHDVLVKGQLDSNLLSHAVQYTLLRHAFRSELEELALRDPLTGLYNRRGFQLLADQSLRLAKRNSRESVLLLADMNDLKEINDTHGHSKGDEALQSAARALTCALRDSDIVGRLGGDEFVALAVEAHPPGINSLLARLNERILHENERLVTSVPLSLSIGIAPFDPKATPSLNDLIVVADRDMYEKKKEYRKTRDGT